MVERLRRWAKRDDAHGLSPLPAAMQIDESVLQDPAFANGCIDKKRYDTEAEAEAFLQWTMRQDRKRKNTGAHAYHCMFCAGWHLGH